LHLKAAAAADVHRAAELLLAETGARRAQSLATAIINVIPVVKQMKALARAARDD
jgi:hypothetical protein